MRLQGRPPQHRDPDRDDKPNTHQSPASSNRGPTKEEKGDEENKHNSMHRPLVNRVNNSNQNGTHKNFRQRYDRSRLDSLKNFGKQLTLAPSPRQPSGQNLDQMNSHPMQHSPNIQNQASNQQQKTPQTPQQQPQQSAHQTQPQPKQQHHQLSQLNAESSTTQQQLQPQQQQQPSLTATQSVQQSQTQIQVTVSSAPPAAPTSTSALNTSTISERSDTSSMGSQVKDHNSELARKSKLNPHAKEFKPRSPATSQGAQANGASPAAVTSGATVLDPTNSSPMAHAPHGHYYQQVPMFPHGLSPHQQQHHAAQFMQNQTHPHFQNQIHYMSPVPPHFAQQMSPRYIRGNFQNYHHRGEQHNNIRADYSQASMMAPTSSGQPFAPQPSGAPHPMNAYAASPQQPMIYTGPPQSMYPVVPAGFPQHMPHVMPNPPPYDGSAVYMPSQNYIVNP